MRLLLWGSCLKTARRGPFGAESKLAFYRHPMRIVVKLMRMHRCRYQLGYMLRCLFYLVFSVSALGLRAETHIRVGSYQDHVTEINAFIKRNGCQPLPEAEINQNQILSEYLIFCNALKLAETDYHITLYPYPLNARILDDIAEGFLDASAMGIWRNEIDKADFQASTALLESGQFVKGFYTTAEHAKALANVKSLENEVVLANANWYHDWAMLTCSGLETVHVDQYKNMFKMLRAGRGNLIPLTFSNKPKLERSHFGVPLYPVPGFKLVFADTTHFAVARAGDKAAKLLADLNQGLGILRQRGEIEAVYRRLGLINADTDSWINVGDCHDTLSGFSDAGL